MLRRVIVRAMRSVKTTRTMTMNSHQQHTLLRPHGGLRVKQFNATAGGDDAAGKKPPDDGKKTSDESVVVENADEETTMDVEDETDARTRERDTEELASELLLEEIELEERGGDDWDLGRAPAHLEARAGRLRRESRALERDAESIFRRTQSRARVRALEMLERARQRREEAREYEARAQLLRETRRRRGDTKPIDDE